MWLKRGIIMKFKMLKAAFTGLVLTVSGFANASLIYNVDIQINTNSITGTLETDGTIGSLVASNFLDVSLILNDSENLMFSYFATAGDLFTASIDSLTFDFINNANGGTVIFFSGNSIPYLCFNNSDGNCDGNSSAI
jgi:hypothetical protein